MVTWTSIPTEIEREIKHIRKYTKDTGKEALITVCRKPGHKSLFVSSSVAGNEVGTQSVDCDLQFGASERIADIHTHPTDKDTLGVMPSTPDIESTMEDSLKEGRPQISCIINSVSPLTECYEPKEMPDRTKVNTYRRALNSFYLTNNSGWFMDQADKDFTFDFFDAETGKKVKNPSPKAVMKAAFGSSLPFYKQNVNELQRDGLCQFIQAFTRPNDDRVSTECKAQLRKRDIVGTIRQRLE